MSSVVRLFRLVPAFALAAGLMWQAAVPAVGAATPTVTLFDNDAPGPSAGFDVAQGDWGYAPAHIAVMRGDTVLFNNPSSNRLPHTVTNIERVGPAFENQVAAGTRFDSSPSRESLVAVGTSWTLDTSTLDQGHYAYYCRIHPWMVGSLTVVGQ